AFNLSHRIFHSRETKLEALCQQPTWHNAAALEYQFGLGPMNKGRNLKHPARRGQPERHAAFPTGDSHHLALRDRVRRSHIDRPTEIVPLDQPFDGVAKIVFVNPGNELAPAG